MFPYIIWRRYLGANTIWYLHSQVVCDKVFLSILPPLLCCAVGVETRLGPMLHPLGRELVVGACAIHKRVEEILHVPECHTDASRVLRRQHQGKSHQGQSDKQISFHLK